MPSGQGMFFADIETEQHRLIFPGMDQVFAGVPGIQSQCKIHFIVPKPGKQLLWIRNCFGVKIYLWIFL
ncbi:hypothetical protein DWZ40_07360 [Clostridium sp. AF32-12BH]|nr:hypothetical protein DWZ40_07360 [Clostridium sp. AF32-12BH]